VAALEARLDERDRMALARDAQHRRELAAAQQERERYQRETIELRGLIASAAEEVNDLKEQLADLRRQLDAERSARTLAEQRAEAAEALARETKGST
jgi:predicted  nucleic acid-binding Zn-ribbon protein